MVQVSRLGNPLVNELFSPLKQRDRWNATDPSDDIQYRQTQVVAPEVPAIVDLLYGTNTPSSGVVVRALKPFPTTNRTDLELILYRGIPVNAITGPNFTTVIGGDINKAVYADELRLNLAIPPNVMGGLPDMNNPGNRRLGLLGGDAAGFPNGRRLFDDTVDIFLRAGAGGTPFTSRAFHRTFRGRTIRIRLPTTFSTDGVDRNPEGFLPAFPVLANTDLGLRHASRGGRSLRERRIYALDENFRLRDSDAGCCGLSTLSEIGLRGCRGSTDRKQFRSFVVE